MHEDSSYEQSGTYIVSSEEMCMKIPRMNSLEPILCNVHEDSSYEQSGTYIV